METREENQVALASGELAGTIEEGVHVFRGVPYAAPPVGDLRWRPPQPVAGWRGVRDAKSSGPSAWQLRTQIEDFMAGLVKGVGHGLMRRLFIRAAMRFMSAPEQSEDCLYLNVRSPDLSASLPVMVWMHGGDHQDGSGSEPFYDSNVLPTLGVVLVTINYRLGLMGYFCHPELTEESDQDVSGNYGTLDQIAALKWVKENIGHFGGDPANVTIFGESAGGESVAHMLTSPLARGLFHRAVLQSPANSAQMQYMSRPVLFHRSAESAGEDFASRLVGDDAPQLDRLRAMPAQDLVKAVQNMEGDLGGYYPVIDGYVLPYSPFECFQRGLEAKVPIMVGSNSDEGSVLWPMMGTPLISHRLQDVKPDDIADLIRAEFGEDAPRIFELYPGLEAGTSAAQAEILGDSMFGAKAYFYAARHAGNGESAFLYYFTNTSPLKNQTAGAFHAAEIPYVFGSEVAIFPIDDAGRELSGKMSRYWRNFALNGDPADQDLPPWQPFGEDVNAWMVLGPELGQQAVDKTEKYAILNRRLQRELAEIG
ncbi:MAG: carboxylesterase family protein [Gammaproteobacteria bacterium]